MPASHQKDEKVASGANQEPSQSPNVQVWIRQRAVPVLVTLLALFLIPPIAAREREQPPSFAAPIRPLDQVELRTMPAVDVEALRREDELHAANQKEPRPYRFAFPIKAGLPLSGSGTWDRLTDSTRIWRLRIRSVGAKNLNIAFAHVDLPEGSKLWIYNSSGDHVEGPYTLKDRTAGGQLWTPVIRGEEIVVELYLPPGTTDAPSLEIEMVNHGYRDFFAPRSSDESSDRRDCHIDVVCPKGMPWRDQVRSVARYSILGIYQCTGQLFNNTDRDFRPYFLSAFHCGVTSVNAESLVFFWNFESRNCGDRGGGSSDDTQVGAIYRAGWEVTDFVLIELKTRPDPDFGVYYAGWDATGATPKGAAGIHHPYAREKAISFENESLSTTAYLCDISDAYQTHWRVSRWDMGSTEAGSSGSCLWNPDNHGCIGQLHGGWANCSIHEPVWYGRLSDSWEGDGVPSTRLRDWLNPSNDGTRMLSGADLSGMAVADP